MKQVKNASSVAVDYQQTLYLHIEMHTFKPGYRSVRFYYSIS